MSDTISFSPPFVITEAEIDEMVAVARARSTTSRPSSSDAAHGARRLGLIVNPVAGLGGRVGLKGTDGAARACVGARPGAGSGAGRAGARGERALVRLDGTARDHDRGRRRRWAGALADGIATGRSSGARPRRRTRAQRRPRWSGASVELMLFAGGDGTARDIVDAVGHASADPRHPGRREDALRRVRREPRGGRRRAGACLRDARRSSCARPR